MGRPLRVKITEAMIEDLKKQRSFVDKLKEENRLVELMCKNIEIVKDEMVTVRSIINITDEDVSNVYGFPTDGKINEELYKLLTMENLRSYLRLKKIERLCDD